MRERFRCPRPVQRPSKEAVMRAQEADVCDRAFRKLVSEPGSRLTRDKAGIHRIPRFAVAVLKGEQWCSARSRGAVHRAPAAPCGAGARVMVAIDIRCDPRYKGAIRWMHDCR